MTPLEYVEVTAVENARYAAQQTARAVSLPDGRNGIRYLWALADELDRQGLNGVRLRHE